jgi:uncharacterized protein with NAD-binding domain and iron-sulfur cluster
VQKKKIAVLGGGVGAMTTTFWLTSFPGWRDRYDVTVYQLGWRLGGKGASGRNQEMGDRIEEHGLHMFFGFYENAFATMQKLYGELGRNPTRPLATWQEAWKPWGYFVLQELHDGKYIPWEFDFPPNHDVPGVGGVLPSPWAMVEDILGWAKELFEKTSAGPHKSTITEDRLGHTLMHVAEEIGIDAVEGLVDGVKHVLHAIGDLFTEGPQSLVPNTFLHLAHYHAKRLPDDANRHGEADHKLLKWLLRNFIAWLKDHWREESKIATEIRRALILLDLGVAVVIGMLEDRLVKPPVDYFKIDNLRFEEWLEKHGASHESANSPPILLLSEIVFARWAGVGAGTCLNYTLRLALTYKGGFAYKMQAGMGDTIFAPFYEVLSRRGVKFEFFSSVEELGVGKDEAGKKVIDTIRIGTQATVKGGGEYQPLYDVKGLPCWPSDPLYDQLVEGEKLKKSGENLENWWSRWENVATRTLVRGKDFDEVVLGISIGAYPYIAKQLIDDPDAPQFGKMVADVLVTQTQAAQIWCTPDFKGMGWALGAEPIIGTYYEPFDTIADMSHLLPRETWPEGTVGNVTYLTAQLPDPDGPALPPRSDWQYPFAQLDRVTRNVDEWLTKYVSDLLPVACETNRPTELNWYVLHDPKPQKGKERLTSQFWIGAWNPSDRYVMSVPGSVWSRLPSAGTGYANLVMAGDWTLSAISSGCVEAAVMGGMHASRAMCGVPAIIVGDSLPDGDDLPRPQPPVPPAPPRPKGTYIDIDGNNTPLQPYAAQNVTMYNFVVEADMDRLQAILDYQFNSLGGPTVYRPLGPFLSFVAATMGPMSPREPKAWLDEKDFGFWIPVIAGKMKGSSFEALRPAFFIPYLWVDEYLPQQAGREVFGYAKGVGVLKNPATPQDPAEFSIDALVIPEYGAAPNPSAEWQWRRLVTLARRGGGAFGELIKEIESIAELGEAVIAQMVKSFERHTFPKPTLELLAALLKDAVQLDVPMVFLKQFRDVADGTRACYQAIVESPNRMIGGTPLRAGFLHGDWELAIEQFASVRMIDKLGLRVVDGKVPAAFHFWVQFAFSAEPGRVVYRTV